jgi:hypothetical protein
LGLRLLDYVLNEGLAIPVAFCISLPYIIFLLNDDMKLNRNQQFLI